MTIYIVWTKNFHGEDVFSGAFSERENAEGYMNRFDHFDRLSMRVEEYALDSE